MASSPQSIRAGNSEAACPHAQWPPRPFRLNHVAACVSAEPQLPSLAHLDHREALLACLHACVSHPWVIRCCGTASRLQGPGHLGTHGCPPRRAGLGSSRPTGLLDELSRDRELRHCKCHSFAAPVKSSPIMHGQWRLRLPCPATAPPPASSRAWHCRDMR